MNGITELAEALDYIETHLTKDIDIDALARKAGCSSYNFQRLFSFFSGTSLSYYIRKRCMSMAAMDLANHSLTVTEAALKYGYESPVSFARAFRKCQGILPSDAQKPGTRLTLCPRLTFEFSVKGEKDMTYRIEKKGGFVLAGVSEEETNVGYQSMQKIPLFWDRLMREDFIEKTLCPLGSHPDQELYGACYGFDSSCTMFRYMVGIRTEKKGKELNGLETLVITPQTYVIFTCYGVKDLQETTKRIFAEWLPQSGYVHANSPELEVYYAEKKEDGSMMNEIWIPIVPKKK
jgi:AraC family transcriptional regulator